MNASRIRVRTFWRAMVSPCAVAVGARGATVVVFQHPPRAVAPIARAVRRSHPVDGDVVCVYHVAYALSVIAVSCSIASSLPSGWNLPHRKSAEQITE